MPHSNNSFDVFDTLIARRSVAPRVILHQLESCAGLPGLAAIRLAADQRVGSIGQPYGLREIWQEVRCNMGLDAASVERLLQLEIQIEHEEVIPIVENLALVRPATFWSRKTYLPADVVLSLLRRLCGLQVCESRKRERAKDRKERESAVGEDA